MIKIYFPNSNGKIEFTKDELEQELNKIYKDGYNEGYIAGTYNPYTITNREHGNYLKTTGYEPLFDGVTISTTDTIK